MKHEGRQSFRSRPPSVVIRETSYIPFNDCLQRLQFDSVALRLAARRPWRGVAPPMTVSLSYGLFLSFAVCGLRLKTKSTPLRVRPALSGGGRI